jgi:hypothetical protein
MRLRYGLREGYGAISPPPAERRGVARGQLREARRGEGRREVGGATAFTAAGFVLALWFGVVVVMGCRGGVVFICGVGCGGREEGRHCVTGCGFL